MSEIKRRKKSHIKICLNCDVQYQGITTGFERYRFPNKSFPEIDYHDIDISVRIFGKTLQAPIIISGMTGGTKKGAKINKNLAATAQKYGIGMGVGSQRIMFEHPETTHTFQVRDVAPDILLLANFGAALLNYGFGRQHCIDAVEAIEADVFAFHLNALQEVIQNHGDSNFGGLIDRIADICENVSFPVIIKEVGCGISADTARRIKHLKLAGVDISGAGGTSWILVEYHRVKEDLKKEIGKTYANWGIPTAQSLVSVAKELPNKTIIASGGIRTGLDIAKAIALGADAVGIAYPFLKPADSFKDAKTKVENVLKRFIEELKACMFGLGARTIEELKKTEVQNC